MSFAAICLALATLANSFANILMKKANTEEYSTPLGLYFSPLFLGGIALFGINLLMYSRSLKNFPLAVAYPILVGGSLILVTFIAHFWLKEPVTIQQLSGIALIMGGLYLVV